MTLSANCGRKNSCSPKSRVDPLVPRGSWNPVLAEVSKRGMKLKAAVAAVVLATSLAVTAQDAPVAGLDTATAELRLGVEAYKNARYEEAIRHFRNAADLDPNLLNARLYLATAYAQQYIPGAETPENTANARQAISEFQKVLDRDPSNIHSIKGMAFLYLQMKEYEKAKDSYMQATKLDPSDPESYYSIGVIDWTQSYQPRMEQRAKLGLEPGDALISHPQCWGLRDLNTERVQDGLTMFAKALELRPDYDDAMAYMNLIYRERADIQCGDQRAYNSDVETADKWVDLTMATKKRKAEKARSYSAQPKP